MSPNQELADPSSSLSQRRPARTSHASISDESSASPRRQSDVPVPGQKQAPHTSSFSDSRLDFSNQDKNVKASGSSSRKTARKTSSTVHNDPPKNTNSLTKPKHSEELTGLIPISLLHAITEFLKADCRCNSTGITASVPWNNPFQHGSDKLRPPLILPASLLSQIEEYLESPQLADIDPATLTPAPDCLVHLLRRMIEAERLRALMERHLRRAQEEDTWAKAKLLKAETQFFEAERKLAKCIRNMAYAEAALERLKLARLLLQGSAVLMAFLVVLFFVMPLSSFPWA